MQPETIPLLKKYKLKPRLELDQSFMVSPETIRKIISLAGIRESETVLEIGAGIGFLTKEIARHAGKVMAVEIDRELVKILKHELRNFDNVEIRKANVLKTLEKEKLNFDKLISNTPYAICEPLIQRLVFYDFKKAVLTAPKSFAYMITAKPGERKYGKPSMVSQEFFDIKIVSCLSKEDFYPRPKTNSVVVLLKPKRKKSLLCEVLLRRRMKLKNAIMQALTLPSGGGKIPRKITKNMARKTIKSLKLNILSDKKVADLGLKELEKVKNRLGKTRRSG